MTSERLVSYRLPALLVAFSLAAGFVACGKNSEDPPIDKSQAAATPAGLLRLTPDEASRVVMEVVPVARGQFRAYREFPATIQPDENELAEVTTLIPSAPLTLLTSA